VLLPGLAPKLGDVEDNRGMTDPPAAAESMRAQALLARAFPEQTGMPAIIVLHDPAGIHDAELGEVRRISTELSGPSRPPHVAGVVSVTTTPSENPVGVRALARQADREGGPTPRRAQDGPRSQCRYAERRRETGTPRPHPSRPSRITGRIQAYAWPERELTWTG
jgi:hypothetical protein